MLTTCLHHLWREKSLVRSIGKEEFSHVLTLVIVWSIPHLCDNKADDTLHFVSEVEEGLHFYIRRALISPDLQCVVACSSSDYSMIQRYHRNAADHWDPASSLMDPTFAGGCGPWADLAWSPCGQYLGSIAQSESLFVLWRPDQHRAVCKRNLPCKGFISSDLADD